MIVKEVLSKEIKPISFSKNIAKAQSQIEGFNLTHIPIVEKGFLVGCISEQCFDSADATQTVESLKPHIEKFQLHENSSIFDSLKLFHTFDTNIIPVTNEAEQYVGVIYIEDIVSYIAKFPFFSELGAVIIVETSIKQYSLVEIGKMVESNNSKFYGAIVVGFENESVQIAVKISQENLSSIGETFERFGYVILSKLYSDKKEDLLDERYQQLMKYMSI